MSTGKDEFTTFAVKTQALTSFAGVLGAGGHSIDLSKSFKVTAHDYEQREPAGGTPVEVTETTPERPARGAPGSPPDRALVGQRRRRRMLVTAWSAPLVSTRVARSRVGSTFLSRFGSLMRSQIPAAVSRASASVRAA